MQKANELSDCFAGYGRIVHVQDQVWFAENISREMVQIDRPKYGFGVLLIFEDGVVVFEDPHVVLVKYKN